jgi:hypothetical protein
MVRYVGRALRTWRVVFGCAVLAALAAGGWGIANRSSSSAHASAPAHTVPPAASSTCAQTVLAALGDVAERVYREGASSERTASAMYLIEHSLPLREAVERDNPQAARAAARALLATGHMTNLTVIAGPGAASGAGGGGGRTVAVAGASSALAPLHGTLTDARGAPIGSFVASVWADAGFLDETDGIAESSVVLRAGGSSPGGQTPGGSFVPHAGRAPIAGQTTTGSLPLPPGELAPQGSLTVHGVAYRYTSFPATAYPTGRPLRVYLFRSLRSIAPLCGATQDDTVVGALSHVATLIYAAEVGRSTVPQIHRVQHNQALLTAVAHGEPEATRLAIDNLLNEHIVRLRVLAAGGRLLSDVGGPYVLAPVRAPLRLNGRTIGSFVLSIQDDMGYRLLAQRLAGLDVVMYRGSQVVMSSFSPPPAHVPTSGPFSYKGATYRALTFMAEAFPSGPLRITDLVPIPYVLGPIAHAAPAAAVTGAGNAVGARRLRVSQKRQFKPSRASAACRATRPAARRKSLRISPHPRARACR